MNARGFGKTTLCRVLILEESLMRLVALTVATLGFCSIVCSAVVVATGINLSSAEMTMDKGLWVTRVYVED